MELQMPRPKLQNIYTVVVRDAENKIELAKYEMHNIAYNDRAFYNSYWNGTEGNKLRIFNTYGNYIDGDTFIMENAYVKNKNDFNFGDVYEDYSNYLGSVTTFLDTTSSFSGDINAISLVAIRQTSSNYSRFYEQITHCNIVDAEGNPITVTKDATNTVTVTGRFYMTITFPTIEDDNVTGIKFFPPQCSSLNNYDNLLSFVAGNNARDNDSFDSDPIYLSIFSYHCLSLRLTGIELNKEENNNFLKNGIPLLSMGNSISIKYSSNYFDSYDNNNKTEIENSTSHSAVSNQFIGYIKSIVLNGNSIIQFPNYEICPKHIYYNYNYGTGNGLKNHFITTLNIIDINNSTLKLNEVSQSSGFNFVNLDISKSPLYNKPSFIFIDSQNYENDKWIKHYVVAASKIVPIENSSSIWQKTDRKADNINYNVYNNTIFNLQMCDKTQTYSPDTTYFVKMMYNFGKNLYNNSIVGIGSQLTYINSNYKLKDYYTYMTKNNSSSSQEGNGNAVYNNKENTFLCNPDFRSSYSKEILFFSTDNEIEIDHFFLQLKTSLDTIINIFVTNYSPDEINERKNYEDIILLKQSDILSGNKTYLNISYFYTKPELAGKEGYKYKYKYWGFQIISKGSQQASDSSGFYDFYPILANNSSIIFGDTAVFDYGTVGLNFDTPPDDGTSIILDAGLDYPYVDENVSFTINGTYAIQPTW